MHGLAERRFLVCGGASGIGEATALRLAEEGARVIIADRDVDAALALAATIPGAEAFGYEQDDPASVARLFASVLEGGPLNGVAIVAGVHPGQIPLLSITPELFTRVHGVNALGVLLVLQQAVSSVERGGDASLVVVSSVAGIRPVARDAVYASSKAAVQAIVRSAALEYAGVGIRVNSVLPGTAITPLAISQASIEDLRRGAAESVPLRRAAEASEVASTIAFLLSEDASHVTATEFVVDGGLAAGSPS